MFKSCFVINISYAYNCPILYLRYHHPLLKVDFHAVFNRMTRRENCCPFATCVYCYLWITEAQ